MATAKKTALTENSLKVLNFLKDNQGKNMTAQDIAEALGTTPASVNGTVTLSLSKRGFAKRTDAAIEVTDENGNTIPKPVKFISITEAGLGYDHAAAVKADAEAAIAAIKADAE